MLWVGEMKMRQPNHITSFGLHNLLDTTTCINGNYYLARPLAVPQTMGRWKLAWLVLTGKADCLTWPGQEYTAMQETARLREALCSLL